MDFLQRAHEAVNAARNLATSVSSDAYKSAQTFATTVSADARGIASEAKQKLGATDEEEEQGLLCSAAIDDDLRDFVSSLTYASFDDFGDAPRHAADAEEPLEAWQVKHANKILQECPELENLRFVLCPRRMPEVQFWSIYFRLVDHLLSAGRHETKSRAVSGSKAGAQTTGASAGSHQHTGSRSARAPPSPRQQAHTQSDPSTGSTWEEVSAQQSRDLGAGNVYDGQPGEEASPEPDDLDEYLKEVLDGSDAPAASGDDAADEHIDDYLNALADEDRGARADEDVNDYLDELTV